ncbi:hypothetical protein SEA_SICARIUS2_76 [Arthrobacter phage Sicarius2]|uniref:Uncharacterized protein n=1 Tax=Arthrobacter phage Sicarius2 TaxID=2836090 RepID=A0A8F3IKE7_9CAUD|nr:hypothetical protein SEA_SICARIUS2_76 [Arthrobacter phage Sicarius2]
MNKRNADRIQKAIAQLKRSYYMLSFEYREAGDSVVLKAIADERELCFIEITGSDFTITKIVEPMTKAIVAAREEKTAREEAEREAALSRPATRDEKRAFERLVDEHDDALKSYARAAGKMRDKIENGEELYSGIHDDLMAAQGTMYVARRLRHALLRDCSIVKTLAEVEDICDRETSFYMPSRSSSESTNVIENHKHKAWLRMGRIARLRAEW